MKFFFMILILQGILISSAFADPPMITKNVPVLQNATPEQCPYEWDGRSGPADITVNSGMGQESGTTAPGVRSCTGCAIDPNSNACVCRTCYQYFDSP